ncbi:MAG: sugar phosphate isomerase/epimerase [Capsulimonadales bacterium]|nr:sugar phosphate isomerase/epimerase [Capsulimonadales bacterium]
MRLCVITDEISQNLGHALNVMAEYGCKDAELRNVYGSYIVDADENLIARVEQDLKNAQMTVPCIDTPFFKCDLPGTTPGQGAGGPTHNARQRTPDEQMHLLLRAIDLCKRFESPYIRIFSFWKRGPLTPDIEERIADQLVRPCEIAERAGITLLLENEHSCYLGTGKETARVIEKVGSPALKMIWDPGNAYVAGERPFPSGYDSAKPHLAHLHIKDARATDEGKIEWTVVGEGEIDYAGQFAALRADGFSGAVSLETHYKGPNNNAEEASRLCLAGMRRLIEAAG